MLFSAGFLLNSSLYRSYAARLASWGCAVLLWDLSEVLDDTMSVAYMRQVGSGHGAVRSRAVAQRCTLVGVQLDDQAGRRHALCCPRTLFMLMLLRLL